MKEKKNQKKSNWQPQMDNRETLETSGTQDTVLDQCNELNFIVLTHNNFRWTCHIPL